MKCVNDGNYAHATVIGVHGGKVPLCDECIGTEPDAMYRPPSEIAHAKPTTGKPVGRPRFVIPGEIHAQPKDEVMPPATTSATVSADVAPAVTEGRVSVINAPVVPWNVYGDERTIVLVLPEPPSANRWWRRHGATMHLSREAKDYKSAVALRARCPEKPVFETEPVSVVIVWRRDRKAGDLDKRLGVLLDALQGVVYANDSQVVQIWARRCDEHPELKPGTVRVEVSPA